MFIAEIPETGPTGIQLVLKVADADALRLDPVVEVVTPFEDTHYGTREMTVRDPDGRALEPPGRRPGRGARRDGRARRPDSTAVRVALWRAMHVEVDAAPHVLEDVVGLQLAAPDDDWRDRGDMHPLGTRGFRASIVARARFIEDLVAEQAAAGVTQYVILGAGLDTLAQRRPELGDRLRIFEVDQPGTQAWKRRRLVELGFGVPDWLRLVPVDFETGESWWDGLSAAGFEPGRPAVVASTGVSMYLTKDATAATLRQLAALAPGSTFVDDVPAAGRARRRGRPPRARGQRPRRPRLGHAVRQLLLARGDARAGPRRRLPRRPARLVRPRSPTATSRAAPTAFARPPARTSCWPSPERPAARPVRPRRSAAPRLGHHLSGTWDHPGVPAPSGTVTFLFTDIVGSTRLWESVPDAMRTALARRDEIVREAVEDRTGWVFATGGDGIAVAFARAGDARAAARAVRVALMREPWPDGAVIQVRTGLPTGEVVERGGDSFGPVVNHAAAHHGGGARRPGALLGRRGGSRPG